MYSRMSGCTISRRGDEVNYVDHIMNSSKPQIIFENVLFIELEAQNYQSPNVSISHQFAIAPLESYSIVTSLPVLSRTYVLVECYKRECDASEENKSQNY